MKKTVITSILALIAISMFAQTWTNYYTGYVGQYSLLINDTLIYVGGGNGINVYGTDGTFKYVKYTGASVHASDKDIYGNLWFSLAPGGILKFDGETWTKYSPNIENVSNSCYSLACDSIGNVWVGMGGSYTGALSKFDGNTWENIITLGDSLTITQVEEILVDSNNVVYAGIQTNSSSWSYGVLRISETDTTIFNYYNTTGMNIGCKHSSYLDRFNNVWMGGCYGILNRFDGETWHIEAEEPIFNNRSFYAIFRDTPDFMWYGMPDGLIVQSETNWIEYNAGDGLYFDYIFDIKSDDNDNIWLAATVNPSLQDIKNGCLTKFGEDGFVNYFPNTYLGQPQDICFRGDEIWLISTGAISVLKDGIWSINDVNEIIPYDEIESVESDAANNIWIVTTNSLYKINSDNSIEQLSDINGVETINIRNIAIYNNFVWVNIANRLFKFNGTAWSEISMSVAATASFTKIIPKNESEIWVATDLGAQKFDGSSWTNYNTEDGLIYNDVNDIAFEDNKVWFATYRGISLLDGETWTSYYQDSTPSLGYDKNSSVFVDKNNMKWFGNSKGLYKFDGYHFFFVQPNNIDENIYTIKADAEDNVWVCGSIGVSKFADAPENIEDILTNEKTLRVYPNPANHEIFVDVQDNISEDVLEIYSTSGKLVYSQTVFNGNNRIALSGLNSGLYLLRLQKSGLFGKVVVE
jgi:ligand-binding sensor domain-containing protein